MNHSEQILKARFEQLPEDVRKAIIATPWKDKLAQISAKHNLHIDQADNLGKETIIVMFGLDHPDNLTYNIAKHVEVSEEKAEAIEEDLNNEIFLKVRESLKKVIEKKVEEREEKEKSFLNEKKEETKEEEKLNREDILRDIEDKEHHNLPAINKTGLHLEVRPPSEVVKKTVNLPSEQFSSQNQKMTNDARMEKPAEIKPLINFAESEREQKIFEKVNRDTEQHDVSSNSIKIYTEQTQKEPVIPQEEAIRTMEKDILKIKMSGTVSVPKETVEVDLLPKLSKKPASDGGKVDPYREEVR